MLMGLFHHAIIVLLGIFCLAVIGLLAFIIFVTRGSSDGDVPEDRFRASDIAPPRDEALFIRLAQEMMAYAKRPFVTTFIEVNGVFLIKTISDAFGKRVYLATSCMIGQTLNTVICVYEDGGHAPSGAVARETLATQADQRAHFEALSTISVNGPQMSFTDHLGRTCGLHIYKQGRHPV